jgi:pterin-4a-carbinolamine dehydratase
MDFVNSVAEIAEEDDHHPNIDIRYNKVRWSFPRTAKVD